MGGKGTEKLGQLLVNQMNSVSGYVSGTPVMLGEITSGLGLKLDSVSYTIPKGDYMVCRTAMLGDTQMTTSSDGGHSHTITATPGAASPAPEVAGDLNVSEAENHQHTVKLPSCFRPIQAGDRVLVAMIGTEYVVVDIILSSDSMFRG